jgi:hypothetical protein
MTWQPKSCFGELQYANLMFHRNIGFGNIWLRMDDSLNIAYYAYYYYFWITQYNGDTHNARTLIPMNTRTQTLPLGAYLKTGPANPQDWQSHDRCLAVNGKHNACTLIPMNTRTQILPLGASSKTGLTNPQDWRSHHRCLAVDRNIAYHWKHKRR